MKWEPAHPFALNTIPGIADEIGKLFEHRNAVGALVGRGDPLVEAEWLADAELYGYVGEGPDRLTVYAGFGHIWEEEGRAQLYAVHPTRGTLVVGILDCGQDPQLNVLVKNDPDAELARVWWKIAERAAWEMPEREGRAAPEGFYLLRDAKTSGAVVVLSPIQWINFEEWAMHLPAWADIEDKGTFLTRIPFTVL